MLRFQWDGLAPLSPGSVGSLKSPGLYQMMHFSTLNHSLPESSHAQEWVHTGQEEGSVSHAHPRHFPPFRRPHHAAESFPRELCAQGKET